MTTKDKRSPKRQTYGWLCNIRYALLLALACAAVACLPDIDLQDEVMPDAGQDGASGSALDDLPGQGGEPASPVDPQPDPSDKTPPVLAPPASGCLVHELAVDFACVGVTASGLTIRFSTSELAKATFGGGLEGKDEEGSFASEHRLVAGGLDPETPYTIEIQASDASGNVGAESLEASTGPETRTVVITEVLVDPNGKEPTQEFVEIYNHGGQAVDLKSWMIDDTNDQNGDLLPQVSILPGQVGVIVSESYDQASGEDPAPAADALLIRVSGTLATMGLKNDTGETVELYDAAGVLVSRFPNLLGKHSEGVSAERANIASPDDDPATWRWNSGQSSSPGTITAR